ncbi:hypothetical protein KFK09_013884 [Dendrobium nobile]|uniref:Uncharacterized protein n=1 Tax=Dendrobium nobile TaxID=94219 RepID=A0A8T3BBF7_DENNO|nr:hypothetical protein KFK09_013884 [Dendrobium nobile]
MPTMDYQSSSVPFSSIGRSLLSLRRDQVHAMDGQHELGSSQEQELDFFQRHVADLFADLSSSGGEELLSLAWVRKLLDSFLLSQEEFRIILFNNRSILSRHPLDRLIAEFYERGVKALDICNAIRDGIEQVRQWQKHIEIVLVSLDPCNKPIGEGQLRRGKKALTDLAVLMLDEKDPASVLAQRNRSFGRNSQSSSKDCHRAGGHFRSLSWSVSRSWSAARQLQAIGNNIYAPRGNEIVSTSGLANPVFTMNSVLHFVMWALVAAIPCQDRGFQTHFSIPRSFSWGVSILSLHDKIMEESKKKERRNSVGLLKEIHQIEKCTRHLLELTDSLQLPITEEKLMELRKGMQELGIVFDALKEGLEPCERQVREVFHRIVRSRMEGLDSLHKHD